MVAQERSNGGLLEVNKMIGEEDTEEAMQVEWLEVYSCPGLVAKYGNQGFEWHFRNHFQKIKQN